MRRRWNRWMGAVLTAIAAGCGGDDPGLTGPDPMIEPFVGTWDAEVFTVTSDANPTVVADLLIDGSFNINVQPSGLYTATLAFGEIITPLVEIGQLSVNGNFATLRPNGPNPCPASAEFFFTGPDFVTLDGPTCFDFNLDGDSEDAQLHQEWQRR